MRTAHEETWFGQSAYAKFSRALTGGVSASVAQSANTILDRFMQIPPPITVREDHRVKLYVTQDMLLPVYENHSIPESFQEVL